MNKPDLAVAEWQKAVELRADPDVVAALAKAEKDKKEEENYKENESAHFQLRYNGAAEPRLAREVLHTLEEHYGQIESELNYSPPDPIGVVLYTQQEFSDITQAPGWVGALNDGRIRVPVQGLTGVNSELSRVLRHELTHSFVQQKNAWTSANLDAGRTGAVDGREAQRRERGRAGADLWNGTISAAGETGRFVDGLVCGCSAVCVCMALANVEYIIQTQGMGDIDQLLDRMAAGSTPETALHDVLRDDYGDLMQGTAEYLKREYVR